MRWRRSGYYEAAGRRRERSVAGRRSGSNIYSTFTGCRNVLQCRFLMGLSSRSSSRCQFAIGFVRVIAQLGCCCLGLSSAYDEPSESVVSGEVDSSRPPNMRPGIAPGRDAAPAVASCTRRDIESVVRGEVRISRPPNMRPGIAPGRDAAPGLPAAHGDLSESVVRGKVRSSRPPNMRPGIVPGRDTAAGMPAEHGEQPESVVREEVGSSQAA